MYICPICNEEFKEESEVVKHLSKCWRKTNPNHQSKSAPRSEDINTRIVSDDVSAFFNSFAKER